VTHVTHSGGRVVEALYMLCRDAVTVLSQNPRISAILCETMNWHEVCCISLRRKLFSGD
jgi:hypothetical protein